MKGFAVDEYGDVIIKKSDIQLTCDMDLLIQKIRQVLRTNRGEWWLDPKEGIPVQKVLRKNPNTAMIRDYVRIAIAQVDKSLEMPRCDITTEGRTLKIIIDISGPNGSATTKMEV